VTYALLPGATTACLVRLTPDGRPLLRALWSLARWRLTARRLAGLRHCDTSGAGPLAYGQLPICDDWRAERYRPGRITGPARLMLRAPASVCAMSERRLELTPAAGRCVRTGRVLHLPANAALELRCERP